MVTCPRLAPLWRVCAVRLLPAALCVLSGVHCASSGGSRALRPAIAARQTDAFRGRLDRVIDTWLAAQDPQLHVGVQVVALEGGAVLYDRRAKERFVPASTVKMLTASAALSLLGPAYRFPTQLLVDSLDPNTGIARTLYVRGSGDPTLEVGDLAALTSVLKQAGIKEIQGELVIDDSDFDAVPWAQGWMWDDLGDGFSAPVSALNVAGNTQAVWLSPGAVKGAPGRVLRVPEAAHFLALINSSVTTARGPASAKIALLERDGGALVGPQPSGAAAPGALAPAMALGAGETLVVSGAVPVDGPPRLRAFAVRDTVAWAGALVQAELRKNQVAAPTVVRRGVVPTTAVPVALHESAALGVLLPQFVKASNNHAMECVLKRIGLVTGGAPGTFASGTQAVRRHVADTLGVDSAALRLADGSGASRYNLVTPEQLAQATCAQVRRFTEGAEFAASLPLAGVDGTLARRLVASPMRGRVRAKTGTMTGISSLAGLLQTEDDETLCFAIMMDGALAGGEALRGLQDSIVLTVGARVTAP